MTASAVHGTAAKQCTDRLIMLRKVSKVVRGGRVLGFSAHVVTGDGNGSVGLGKGHGKDFSTALQKAGCDARKNMVRARIGKGRLAHESRGRHGATSVVLLPARAGRGIVAGNHVRSVLTAAGITDAVAKRHGSSNPMNVARAAIDGLLRQNPRGEV
ncbi:30S ribosomal protein S5 [Candidatus Tremblaya princeps]|uniref:Small ribosomal subunit protein uS5 n=1 Tax=Tremblaya princeps TaxID=189385 RepID=A0A143WNV4_TREPR|nr:30S ribosomal protein S5 [Candidatus Tremblaya princeps]